MGGDDFVPTHAQGVGVADAGVVADGVVDKIAAKIMADLLVHEVFGKKHGDLGDLAGEVFDFDAKKLVDGDLGGVVEEDHLPGFAEQFQNFKLELAQLLVGDDQEIAAATGRVEKGERGELAVEGFQFGDGTFGALEFFL